MKPGHGRTILAGIAGGISMNVVMLLTFRLIGFGWEGGGILLASPAQSKKLIAVWTEIEPIPMVVTAPGPIIVGIILFGVAHAYMFSWLSAAWPEGVFSRGARLAGLVFMLQFLFWEFFTPFNMFGEPLHLIALELVFWACIASADGLAIAAVMEKASEVRRI